MTTPANASQIAALFSTTPAIINRLVAKGLLPLDSEGKISVRVAQVAVRNDRVMGAIRTIRNELASEASSVRSAREQQSQKRYANSGQGRAENSALRAAERAGRLSVEIAAKLKEEQRLQDEVEELRKQLEAT